MLRRPACVVNIQDVPGEPRPRYTKTPGVAAVVHPLGVATGLTRMGAQVRTVAPGHAGTNRHFHTVEEEWTYVLSGHGTLRIGPLDFAVGPGHFAGYPPGPRPHHFVNGSNQDLVFLEGGESRPGEDGCWYPDAKMMSHGRKLVEPYQEPPPEFGDHNQVRHIDGVPVEEFLHDVDTRAKRRMRSLHAGTGLERQAVYWAEVGAGDWSTAFHCHDRTDEWAFILDGSGVARVGDDTFDVGPLDFIAYPAGGPPHVIEAMSKLTYLMGGQVDSTDVVEYPIHRMRRIGSRLEPMTGNDGRLDGE